MFWKISISGLLIWGWYDIVRVFPVGICAHTWQVRTGGCFCWESQSQQSICWAWAWCLHIGLRTGWSRCSLSNLVMESSFAYNSQLEPIWFDPICTSVWSKEQTKKTTFLAQGYSQSWRLLSTSTCYHASMCHWTCDIWHSLLYMGDNQPYLWLHRAGFNVFAWCQSE